MVLARVAVAYELRMTTVTPAFELKVKLSGIFVTLSGNESGIHYCL